METKETKARVNGIKEAVWGADGKLTYSFVHGAKLVVDPALMSASMRDQMMRHGIEARIGDKGAVEAKDFPDRKERAAEACARMAALVEHVHSGTDTWDMKSGARASGPDVALLVRALTELGHVKDLDGANALFQAIAARDNIERDAVVKSLWDAKDVQTLVKGYRLERQTFAVADVGSLIGNLKKA